MLSNHKKAIERLYSQKMFTRIKPPERPNIFLDTIWVTEPTIEEKDVQPSILLTSTSNRSLECVALVCTHSEVESSRFDRCLDTIHSTPINKDISLYVIVNNYRAHKLLRKKLQRIKHIFKEVKHISLNIPEDEDIYIRNSMPIPKKIPRYGLTSGPNYMFLKTMKICSKFNTTLLLEPDCIVTPNWLERLSDYVRHSGGFWIAGALYDGNTHPSYWTDEGLSRHINGVALYATGDESFQKFLQLFERFLRNRVLTSPYAGYDHMLNVMIQENLKTGDELWRFANRNYIHTQLIVNYSRDCDKDIPNENIKKKYDYAILHKK